MSHVTGYTSREDDATFLLLTLRYRPPSSLCSYPSSNTRSVYKETEFLTSRLNKLQYGKLNWPLHQLVRTYHGSQQDALFLNVILINNSTCFGQTYCPSSGVLILHSQQLVFVVLVMLTEQTVNITNMIYTNCCECSIKTPDDGQ